MSEETDKKIEELTNLNKELAFFSNQTQFNAVLYNFLSAILEKLNKIESNLNLPKLPELPQNEGTKE